MTATDGLRRFFSELKRRHVFKVGAIYAAFLVTVLAFASDLENAMSVLPDWTDTLVIILVLLGLPVALIIAWAFELTPEGVRRTQELDAAAERRRVPPRPRSELASIAVLPFHGAASGGDEAFLATAIPLELNNTLSRVHRLRIVSGQSSFAHSRDGKDLRGIAAELDVNYVISGNVSRIGKMVRVIAELYDAVSDTLLWTERFDLQVDQAFDTERKIAEAAAMAFGGERLRLEVERARTGQTTDQTAWELVQRARAYLLNYTPEAVDSAVHLLKQAVERDPDYAVGHAQLGLVTAEKTLNAIGNDPDADRSAALAAVSAAENLAPSDPVVLRSAGVVQAYCGDYAESLRLLRRATTLAPYDLGAWGYFGWPLAGSGSPEHLAELHRILDPLLAHGGKHPGRPYWQFHKSVACCIEDDCEAALELIESAVAEQPRFAIAWMHLANVRGLLGHSDAAMRAVDRSLRINPGFTAGYYAALIARLTGSADAVARRTDGLRLAGILGEPHS